MPETGVRHIVVCETQADVEPAKKLVESQGGKVEKEYTIFPGFDVVMPKDSVSALGESKHIKSAEIDGVVSIN